MERARPVQLQRARCPYCHAEVEPSPERTACNACGAWHHQACWDEGGECSACGFVRPEREAPAPAPAPGLGVACSRRGCERPATHWLGRLGRVYCHEHALARLHRRRFVLAICAGLILATAVIPQVTDVAGGALRERLLRLVPFLALGLAMAWGSWRSRRHLEELAASGSAGRTEPAPPRPNPKAEG